MKKMLVYLNGEHNLIIIPKETLEALHNPRFFQFFSDGKGILIRYSNRKLAEAAMVEYPLKNNSFGMHVRNENFAKTLRNRYKWDNYIYAVDAIKHFHALDIDPGTAMKTEIENRGL